MTKPFGMAELEAAAPGRAAPAAARSHGRRGVHRRSEVGDLDIDLVHHMATLGDRPAAHGQGVRARPTWPATPARSCTHHMILKDVWGPGYGAESNYAGLDPRRRKKMGDDEGRLLKTVPGVGYQLEADAHEARERVERIDASRARLYRSGVPSAMTPGVLRDPRSPRSRPMNRRITAPVPSASVGIGREPRAFSKERRPTRISPTTTSPARPRHQRPRSAMVVAVTS